MERSPTGGASDSDEDHRNDPEGRILAALDRDDRRGALEQMMTAYGSAIYRFCRHMVADEAAADDAHQVTFIQAYESLPRFARKSSVRTWLYSIARHRCLDAVKRRRRRWARFDPLPDAEEPRTDLEVQDPAPDERLLLKVRHRHLLACLETLRAETRSAVLLRFQAGLTYPEMARTANEQPATLQARVARALPTLRRCLESRGLAA